MKSKIFSDLLVIELASVLAGPAVGMFFAELGARVIKIENQTTGGDVTRFWKVPGEDFSSPDSAYYHSVNWGKETVMMNLNEPDDYEQVKLWIQQADVVISNFRTSSAKKLKLSYEHISSWNPQIIYCSVSAYGEGDNRPGFDAMIQAETGWVFMNGPKGGPPVKLPVALMDILAAHQMKQGILIGLIHRMKKGVGSKVTVSLYDSAISALANQASNYLNLGVIAEPKGSEHPNIAPYGDIFYTSDNVPVMTAIGNEKQFQGLCEILGLHDLPDDPLFEKNTLRVVHREALNEKIAGGFKKISWHSLEEQAEQKNIPLASIKNLKRVFEEEMAQALILEEKKENRNSRRIKTAVFHITPTQVK